MDRPLIRLAEASGIRTTGAHEWPPKVDEDIADFVSSIEPRALFVVEQDDGLLIGPPPRSSEDRRALVIVKPSGTLPEEDWDLHVASATLPLNRSLIRQLHALLSQGLLPVFDSQVGKAGVQARHRLVEAERALAHLLSHTQVEFVDLNNGALANRVQKTLKRIQDDNMHEASATDLNELQSAVNTWKQQVANLAASDRDVREGSVSDEIGFWVTLESALLAVEEQLSGSMVTGVFQALETNKRFHATHNFAGETGLNEAITKVQGYTQILFRDLPIGEMLAASNFEQLAAATDSVFTHLNRKLRTSGYPSQRSVGLAEAIGKDFSNMMSKITETMMEHALDTSHPTMDDLMSIREEVTALKRSVVDVSEVWDSHVREFATVVRDLMRRRADRFVVVKVETTHTAVVSRISLLESLCSKHVELSPLLQEAGIDTSKLNQRFMDILLSKNLLHLDDSEWSDLEADYSREAHTAESRLAEDLRLELSSNKDDESELYHIFERHQQVLMRPEVRIVAHKFQDRLLANVKAELRAAERRSKELPDRDQNLVKRVIKMQQLSLRAQEIRSRLQVILGPTWKDHAEGAQLGLECDDLESKMDAKKDVKEWSEQVRDVLSQEADDTEAKGKPSRHPLLTITKKERLSVFDSKKPPLNTLRALKSLGYRIDPYLMSIMQKLSESDSAAVRLKDCVATLESIVHAVSLYPRIEFSKEIRDNCSQAMAFVRLGLTRDDWNMEELSEFVFGFEQVCSLLENKVIQYAKVDCKVTELLSESKDLNATKSKLNSLLDSVASLEYGAAVKSDLSRKINKVVAYNISKWKPIPVKHTIFLIDRSIHISPDLSYTVENWLAELNQLTAQVIDVDSHVASAFANAMAIIQNAWTTASRTAEKYVSLQPLWDLNIKDTLTAMDGDAESLLTMLRELEPVTSVFSDTSDTVTFDSAEFRALLEAKRDAWQNELGKALADSLMGKAVSMLSESVAIRKNIERANFDIKGLIIVLQTLENAKSVHTNLSNLLPLYTAAQRQMDKNRFSFPKSWVTADQIQQELDALDAILQRRTADINEATPRLRKELDSQIASVEKQRAILKRQWISTKPLQSDINAEDALNILEKFDSEVGSERDGLDIIEKSLLALESSTSVPSTLELMLNDNRNWLSEIQELKHGWTDLKTGWDLLRATGNKLWFQTDVATISKELNAAKSKIDEYPDRTKQLKAYTKLTEFRDACIDSLEKVITLRESSAIGMKHLIHLVPTLRGRSSDNLLVSEVWTKLPDMSVVLRTVETADGEQQLLNYLGTIDAKWEDLKIVGRDGAIQNFGELIGIAREHLAAFKAMRASPYFSAVAVTVQDWEHRIGALRQAFDKFVEVQQNFIYLRGVLSSQAVATVLPSEARRFRSLAEEFEHIYNHSVGHPALEIAGMPRIASNLDRLSNQFYSLRKSLLGYLEVQRKRCPRLYFVGDEDLLEIVGSPISVWGPKHFPSIFPGIAKVHAEYVVSSEGERLYFTEPFTEEELSVNNLGLILEVEKRVSAALLSAIQEASRSLEALWPDADKLGKWAESVPVQAAVVALRARWTSSRSSMKNGNASGYTVSEIKAFILWLASNGDSSLLWSRRREAIIAELSHEVEHYKPEYPELALTVAINPSSVVVHRGSFTWKYGLEYLGAYEPIVQTRITDDLYFFASSSIAQKKGACIVGPAGTGKTESIKALGTLYGRRVIVFNCDDRFDFLAVSRVMAGCAATKSWACFDEFNRLSKGVLSSVAELVNENVRNTPVFVTMNPDYSGRNILPPNMRDQFRQFTLEDPDALEVARVLLSAHGNISSLAAESSVQLLESMSENASNQRHYDWGLRTLKGIVRISRLLNGNVKEACKFAIRPRLVMEDQKFFDLQIDNLFNSGELESQEPLPAEFTSISKTNLPLPLMQCLQDLNAYYSLYPGVLLLGPSGSGKTRTRQALIDYLDAESLVIDPSAVSKDTLIGKLDPITREWKDGLLSSLLRKVISNLRGEQNKHWFVVFDGEIEPNWAEALNSLLDDNRQLTLASGEILVLPQQVHIVFETTTLEAATPATISRCGIICFPPYPREESMSAIPPKLLGIAQEIHHAMEYTESRNERLLQSLNLGHPALNMVWILAGDSDSKGRLLISDAIREFFREDSSVPVTGDLTNYFVSELTGKWHSWEDSLGDFDDLPPDAVLRPDIVIRTPETLSLVNLLQSALTAHLPLLLVGPPGSGKTMTLFNALRQVQQISLISLNFSAASTPELVIQALRMHCELIENTDGTKVLSPPGSKWAVLFIDEINLPQPGPEHESNIVPVIQFMKYLIEYGGFYTAEGEYIRVERVQVVGACNPPPQRRPLPLSLLRQFLVVRMDHPVPASLKIIYGSFLKRFDADTLTDPMVDLYKELSELLPNEIWTPRELTRWTRGIYTSWNNILESQRSFKLLCQIWAYEASRVLADRLDSNSRLQVNRLIAKYYPGAGIQSSLDDFLQNKVWSYFVSKRPKFVEIDELRRFLEARLSVFVEEASGEADIDLVIHSEFVQHISRVDRVLRQPQGHALLIGPASVGKTTTVKFAAWLCGLDLRIFRSHSRYTDVEFTKDLRAVLLATIKRPLCILMGDDLLKIPEFIERMNSLLANGEVPGLFENPEQLKELDESCRRAGFSGGDLVPWFRARIVRNLHVVFATTDVSNASPALLNRCVVDKFESWPACIKQQVAERWCSRTDVDPGMASVLASIDSKFGDGGLEFIENCRQFVRVYSSLKTNLEDDQRHFISGVDRLKSTVLEISQLKKQLANRKGQLQEEDERSSQVLSQMLNEQSEAERKRVAAIEIRAALQTQAQEIGNRQKMARDDLASAEPLIRQAAEGVQNIRKSQLNELRSLMNPPEPVKITLEAVCLLLGLKTDGSWRQVLAAVRGDEFIPRIVNFDSAKLSPALIGKIEVDYMSLPSFTYERVDRASKAGGPLLRWVVAQVAYGRALASIEPLLAEISKLNEQSAESRAQLSAIESMLSDLESAVESSKKEYQTTIAHCEVLKAEMQKITLQLERAEALLSSLSGEKDRWQYAAKSFPTQMATLSSKALLESSFIARSGKLDPKEKKELANDVIRLMKEQSVKLDEKFANFVVETDYSHTILEHSWSVVLMIDSRDEWENNFVENSNVKVTSFLIDHDSLEKEVEAALRFGQTLVICHTEQFDSLLMPLINHNFVRRGTRLFVNLGENEVDVAPGFRLLLHARNLESVTQNVPLVVNRVNIVDYTVTINKFEQLVNDTLLMGQMPELANRRTELRKLDVETSQKLRELEKQLLMILSGSPATENLLENQTLVNSLENLKKETVQLEELKSSIGQTLIQLEEASEKFAPQAQIAASVYAEVRKLPDIDKFYVMGVEWLLELVRKLSSETEFAPKFREEVRTRVMSLTRAESWPHIKLLRPTGSRTEAPLGLIECIEEAPSSIPIIAGMSSTNTDDPAEGIVLKATATTSVVAMGSSQSDVKADRLLSQAMELGEWLIIQNIEIASEKWTRTLIRRLQTASPSNGFRLIFTGLQSELIAMPELLSYGRPITVERFLSVKLALAASLLPTSDATDFAVCWIHACLSNKFASAAFSRNDLDAARWFVHNTPPHALKKALVTAVWGAKFGDAERRALVGRFADTAFAEDAKLPSTDFSKWVSTLPNDENWLPQQLS